MAQYTEILNDGTRRVVTYNPRHDGPVSEHLTLNRKIRWLNRWCQNHPADLHSKEKLNLLNKKAASLQRGAGRTQSKIGMRLTSITRSRLSAGSEIEPARAALKQACGTLENALSLNTQSGPQPSLAPSATPS